MISADENLDDVHRELAKVREELDLMDGLLRLKSRESQEVLVEDDGESNWLVSYADMMTLLFGFFVIISAFSTPDSAKMEVLKKETSESMGGKYVQPYEEMGKSLKKTLQNIQLDKEVSVIENADGVTITSKGTLFFDSGSAVLKERAALMMDEISNVLATQAKGFRIVVEGHTDDMPIVSREYPSNWELSSARASAVVRLLEGRGFPSKDLRPVGLAATESVAPNRDGSGKPIPANQAMNRRIVIRVRRQLPSRMTVPGGY